MAITGYKNLTQDELEFADHYAESGNSVGLRRMQELSASREGKQAKDVNPERYYNPMMYTRTEG